MARMIQRANYFGCPYGCCRDDKPSKSHRAKEKRQWRKEWKV